MADPQSLTMRSGLFPATQWTRIVEAREAPTDAARLALDELARGYWQPLFIFLRQRGAGAEDAADLVQGFFEHLLARDFLDHVRMREGKFRTFLLTSLTRWLDDQRDRAQAQKWGGGAWHVPLDEAGALVAMGGSPAEAFDRRWARSLFDHALARLGEECAAGGRGELFAALRGVLAGETCEPYAAIGARLGMSEGAVKKAAFDFRARFAAGLRAQVRGTVRDEAAVDEELRYLIRLLRT